MNPVWISVAALMAAYDAMYGWDKRDWRFIALACGWALVTGWALSVVMAA